MLKVNNIFTSTIICLFGSIIFLPNISNADNIKEAVVHSVEDFTGTNRCTTSSNDRPDAASYRKSFVQFMEANGFETEAWKNMGVDIKDFTTHDHVSPYGTDYAEVVFISSHGGYDCSNDTSYPVMGDCRNNTSTCNQGSNCRPRYQDMRFGDTETRYLILMTCNSLRQCIVQGGNQDQIRAKNRFARIMGYHGSHKRTDLDKIMIRYFLGYGNTGGVGRLWVEWMTEFRDGFDNCAVTYGWGSNSADEEDNYLNSGWSKVRSVGSGYAAYRYMNNCNPKGANTLKGTKLANP